MEPPNFWPSTYLSAAIIPPLPVATKHRRLIQGQQGQSRLRRGRKTRGEQRRRGVRKCHRETLSHASGPRVEGAELFRTAAPPGFLCSQWRAGKAPSLWFNSEDRTPLLRVWKQLKANSDGRGNNYPDATWKRIYMPVSSCKTKVWNGGTFILNFYFWVSEIHKMRVRDVSGVWIQKVTQSPEETEALDVLGGDMCTRLWCFIYIFLVSTVFFKRVEHKQTGQTCPNRLWHMFQGQVDHLESRGCSGG